jgi:hypothetical protein
MINEGNVTEMKGIGIQLKSKTCPEKANCKRHSGGGGNGSASAVSHCRSTDGVMAAAVPLYSGVMRTLDK